MVTGELSDLDFASIPTLERIDQVRTGSIKKLSEDGSIASAILKLQRPDKVYVGYIGLAGDQQQSPVHGGVHKALHQYSASHYKTWQQEESQNSEMFTTGAFGENLVTYGLNEENVCIGDRFFIGKEVIVEVSEPRVPCYKLNHRFQWPQAQKRTHRTGRIGWYLRVIRTGFIQAGDSMQLLCRPYPKWSIQNTHKVLHSKYVRRALLQELSQVVSLGPDIQALARRRLADTPDWKTYHLQSAKAVTKRVRQLTFCLDESLDHSSSVNLPECAYVNIQFGSTEEPFKRSYSVVSGDRNEFVLGVALDDHSRGGSKYLHDSLQLGEQIKMYPGKQESVESPAEGSPENDVKRHIFIIGGIGVTAFINKIKTLEQQNIRIRVHYACRSVDEAAYADSLPAKSTTFYAKDRQERLDVNEAIPPPSEDREFSCKIYSCGPSGLMNAVEARCRELEYPDHLLHFESFGVNAGGPLGDPFQVEVSDPETEKKAVLQVPAEQTLLKVLNDAGFNVESNCQAGKCGICALRLCSGKVDHKGTALTEEGKQSTILTCVSRGKGKIEIEID